MHSQVLNLFLALLLSNFGSSSLSAPTADNDTNKIAEAFNRISRFKAWVKRSILNGLKALRAKISNQIGDQMGHPGKGCPNSSWNKGSYQQAVPSLALHDLTTLKLFALNAIIREDNTRKRQIITRLHVVRTKTQKE